MSKLLKSLMVDEYRQAFDGVTSCVLVDVSPLKVGEVEDFRRHLRENEVRLRVVKNSLASVAIKGMPLEPVSEMFDGPTAVAYHQEDHEGITTIKAIKSYLTDKKKLKVDIKGGIGEGQTLSPSDLNLLAATPEKPVLQAMLLGAIQGPARGIAMATQGVASGLARVLKARIEKEGGGD